MFTLPLPPRERGEGWGRVTFHLPLLPLIVPAARRIRH